MKKTLYISLLALMMLVLGCSRQPAGEAEPRLSTDTESISAPSSFGEGDSKVFTVVVRSNRSWTAFVNDLDNPSDPVDEASRVTWVTLSTDLHQNLSGVQDETALELTFTDNDAALPRRGELDIYCGGGIMARIPIVQAASVTP